jgi:hypothetical protein
MDLNMVNSGKRQGAVAGGLPDYSIQTANSAGATTAAGTGRGGTTAEIGTADDIATGCQASHRAVQRSVSRLDSGLLTEIAPVIDGITHTMHHLHHPAVGRTAVIISGHRLLLLKLIRWDDFTLSSRKKITSGPAQGALPALIKIFGYGGGNLQVLQGSFQAQCSVGALRLYSGDPITARFIVAFEGVPKKSISFTLYRT